MTTYAAAGIDLEAARCTTERLGPIVANARGAGVLADVGAFGGMFRLGASGEYRDPVLVSSTDGIGTKVQIATTLGRYDALGFDIVNHCVNDIAVQGARPLFFLDYLAMHRAEPEIVAILVSSVVDACAAVGCSLLGGETAEMPDVYPPGQLDVAGFVVGVVERDEIGANGVPAEGDVLLGLPSDGLHTNGYSLARRALPAATWAAFDPELGMTVGDALLVPHRSYLAEVAALAGAGGRGFAHITGGGLPDNVARVIPDGLAAEIDTAAWEPAAIFRRIAREGGIAADEMYRVFNMGVGMVAIVPAARVAEAAKVVPEAVLVGQIVARGDGDAVRLLGVER